MAAFRTLWMALVSLYEETLVLVGANLAAIALNLPLGIVMFVGAWAVLQNVSQPNAAFYAWVLVAGLTVFLPTPGNVALAGLTREAAGPDVPRFHHFKGALRTRWRLALQCWVISVAVLAALIWNVTFYVSVGTGWLQFISILWLYAVLLWLSLHVYLVPLMVHVADPRVLDLYRRAVFVTLGHLGYTLLAVLVLLILTFLSVVFLPVYVLVAPALVSLTQAHALREIRRRHGDLAAEAEEEVSRL
jgi:uncharacterized membrane protein YesL